MYQVYQCINNNFTGKNNFSFYTPEMVAHVYLY